MSRPVLEATVRRRIHPGLTVDATLALDAEIGVLFGRSGAGKSSILRMIAGLDRPDSGRIATGPPVGPTPRIWFDSATRVDRPLRERGVGFVTQCDTLFPHLDVRGNIAYGLREPRRWAVWMHRSAVRDRVEAMADAWGVGPLLDRRVGTLSGGERQRVALARAIAPRPLVLLADEPVSALDRDARYRLLGRLRAIQRAEAIPVLLVTHAVDEALSFGDRLFLVDSGRITAEGTPHAILVDLARGRHLAGSHLQNVVAGTVLAHDPAHRSTTIQLANGPALIIPPTDHPAGATVLVRVDAEEIVLARGPVGVLSARNLLPGTVERIVVHEAAAEVFVRVGATTWVVGVIEPTVRALDLTIGAAVTLIIKARSCRPLLDAPPGPGNPPPRANPRDEDSRTIA